MRLKGIRFLVSKIIKRKKEDIKNRNQDPMGDIYTIYPDGHVFTDLKITPSGTMEFYEEYVDLEITPSGTMSFIEEFGSEDNAPYVHTILFYLSHPDWCELQEKDFYRELVQYLGNLKKQRSKMPQHEQEDLLET